MTPPVSAIGAAFVLIAMPFAALADKPDHAGKSGKKQHKIERKHSAKTSQAVRAGRDPVVVVSPAAPVRVQARACPPGLAKKDPACVPPGQAKKAYEIGNVVDWNGVHVVTRPGLYGLGDAPNGQRYAIIDGRLVRIDSETGRILSVLRVVEAILD